MDTLEWHQLACSGLSECLPPLMTICLRAEWTPRPASPLRLYTVTQTQAPGLPLHQPLLKTIRLLLCECCYGENDETHTVHTFAKYWRFFSLTRLTGALLKTLSANLLSLQTFQILSLTHQWHWRSHLLTKFLINNVSDGWIKKKWQSSPLQPSMCPHELLKISIFCVLCFRNFRLR